MQKTHPMIATTALLLTSLACSPPPVAGDPFERFELANGIEVASVHIPGAQRQTTFALLPLGLLSDDPGRAQFSHLCEHMLIYGVDPELLDEDGLEYNGETTGNALRLDVYAEPEAWEASIRLQAAWLAASDFEDGVLEREKGRIEGEESMTTRHGALGKWAQAAFSQVALGGLDRAAIHGDVADATVDQVEDYLARHLTIGSGVRVVTVGPVDPKELRRVIEAEIGAVRRESLSLEEAALPKLRDPFAFGDGRAEWDLDGRAYLEWYPLPSGSPEDRAAAIVLSVRLNQMLFQSTHPDLGGGRVIVDHSLDTPAGRGIMLVTTLSDSSKPEDVRAALRETLDRVTESGAGLPDLAFSCKSLAIEVSGLPPWELVRDRAKGMPNSHMAEANVILGSCNLEFGSGMTLPELEKAFGALDAEGVEALVEETLAPAKRSSLVLEREGEGE